MYFDRFRQVIVALEAHEGAPFRAVPAEVRREIWTLFGELAAFAFTPEVSRAFVRRVARVEPLMTRVMPMENWQTYVQILRAYLERGYDMRDVVAGLSIPMTILVGGASRMYPPEGQRAIADLLPSARVVTVEDAGHFLPFEAPRVFQRELVKFLS